MKLANYFIHFQNIVSGRQLKTEGVFPEEKGCVTKPDFFFWTEEIWNQFCSKIAKLNRKARL
jgi:hypothetical protein